MDKSLYITTTRDKFVAETLTEAFRKYTYSFKWRTWTRVFGNPENPDEQDIRDYWEFKAMVTKGQEQKLRNIVKECKFPMNMRRRLV